MRFAKGWGFPPPTPDVNTFGYWAPSVVKVKDDLYRMYYSIVVPGLIDGDNSWGERAFIGMMENTNPLTTTDGKTRATLSPTLPTRGLDFHVSPPTGLTATISLMQLYPSVIIKTGGRGSIYGSPNWWYCRCETPTPPRVRWLPSSATAGARMPRSPTKAS